MGHASAALSLHSRFLRVSHSTPFIAAPCAPIERGESLWAAGTPFEKIFFFDSGLARTSIISVSGSNRVIAWQGPGTMFPVIHRNRFEIETRHLTEAVTAVAALEFSAVDIEAYLRGSADFALATIDWYAKFVNLLLYSAADVSTSPNTLTALASTLLLLFRNEAGAVMATNNLLKITQSELAALLGVDRASLVRALSALRKKGAVATLRGAIKLLSPEILQQAAARS